MDGRVKNILVVRFSALGDVAMLLPVIALVAQKYPADRITFLTSAKCVPLCNVLPDNVIIKGVSLVGTNHTKWENFKNTLKEIQYKSFDVLLDLNDVWRSRYIRWLFFINGKKTYVIKKAYITRWLITHLHWHVSASPVQQRYIDVFNKLGYNLNLSSLRPFQITSTTKSGIGIAPFAKHFNKIYPIEKMEKVVMQLSKKMSDIGETIYLFGGGEMELNVLYKWAQHYSNVQVATGKKTLYEELGLIQSLRLMLSMDSANMHLASIVGTQVISIWGATHPKCGFYDFNQKKTDCIQQNLPCRPCSVYGKRKCKYGDKRCMDIDEQLIINKIMKVYA